MAVLCNIALLINTVAFGFSCSISTLVGNSIGAGNEKLAKIYMRDGFFTCVVFYVIVLTLIFCFKQFMLSLLTSDHIVLQAC